LTRGAGAVELPCVGPNWDRHATLRHTRPSFWMTPRPNSFAHSPASGQTPPRTVARRTSAMLHQGLERVGRRQSSRTGSTIRNRLGWKPFAAFPTGRPFGILKSIMPCQPVILMKNVHLLRVYYETPMPRHRLLRQLSALHGTRAHGISALIRPQSASN